MFLPPGFPASTGNHLLAALSAEEQEHHSLRITLMRELELCTEKVKSLIFFARYDACQHGSRSVSRSICYQACCG